MSDLRVSLSLSLLDKATAPLRRAAAAAQAMAGGAGQAQRQLRELQKQHRDIGALNQHVAAQKRIGQQWAESASKAKELSAQLERAEAARRAGMVVSSQAINTLKRDSKAAKAESDNLKRAYMEQGQAIDYMVPKLAKAGIGTDDLAGHEARLKAQIDSTTKAIERRSKAHASAAKLAKMGAALTAGGLGARMLGQRVAQPIGTVLGAYTEQESATSDLASSMMLKDGSIAPEMQKMNALAQKLGDRLPGTTADFIEMFTMLRRQGLSAQTVLGGTGEAAAYLGVQMRMPVTAAAEFAAKMQDATRTTERDMMGLMDTIQRTYYLGVDSDNMLQGFTKLSPVLSIIKKEGLDAANALAPMLVMFDQAGMRGESSGNALRKVMQGALNLDKVGKGSKIAGVRLDFTDGKGNFGGIDTMMDDLAKLKHLNAVQQTAALKAMFGDDAETLQVLSILMDKGRAGYQEVVDKMKAQADLRMRVDKSLGTLKNLWEAVQGTFTNVLASIGEAIAPDAKAAAAWLSDMGTKVGTFVKENQGLVRILALGVAGFAALAVVLGTAAMAVGSIVMPIAALRMMLPAIIGAVFRMGGVFTKFWGLLKANPIVSLLAGVYGLVQYFVNAKDQIAAAWKAGDWIAIGGHIIKGLWAGINTAFMNIPNLLLGLFQGLINTAKSVLGIHSPSTVFAAMGSDLIQGLINGVLGRLGALRDTIVGAAQSARNWFADKLGIRSPSRVFAQMGGWISEGAALGIAGRAPLVARAAAAMAALPALVAAPAMAATGPSFASQSAGAPTAGNTYKIELHIASGDPQAIEAAVRRAIIAHERDRTTSRNGRMTD